MAQDSKDLDVAWQSFSEVQRDCLVKATERLDGVIRECVSEDQESPTISATIGGSSEWTSLMRAHLASWHRDGGWQSIGFSEGSDGLLTVVLQK